MHHRDLPRRAAEGEERDPAPDPHRLGEGDAVAFRGVGLHGCGHAGTLFVGQL